MLSFFHKSEMLNNLERYTILITTDNNHIAVIMRLEAKKLIFKDAQSSDIYPIYRVDRTLMRKDFSDELESLFGQNWLTLKTDYKEVLNAIYLHNQFAVSSDMVTANGVGTYIYMNHNKTIEVAQLKNYENLNVGLEIYSIS